MAATATTSSGKSSRKDTGGAAGRERAEPREQKDQCHAGGNHYHRESRNHFHKSYDRSWEKWEKFREKKMEMMKAHKYNVEHRLKYDNQERILYRHHFNYYPVKRPRPRKTSLEPNWYTENIYSNQSIDHSDGELGVRFPGDAQGPNVPAGAAGAVRDINGNLSLADDGIFTIDGHFERRNHYPKSSSCCFGATGTRMRDIDEAGDGLELAEGGWNERYPRLPKSYSFSTSRSMGVGFNMGKLYNRNSFEMPEFPGHRHRQTAALSDPTGRTIVRMCDREGCFNETCFTKDEKNFFFNNQNNNNNHNHVNNNNNCNSNNCNINNCGNNNVHHNHNNIGSGNANSNTMNNISSGAHAHHANCNIISEWNLRNRNNLRARGAAHQPPEGVGARPQYVMEEDFDLFDEDDDDDCDEDEEESELNTLYADDRHSIAYGDYGGVARQLYGCHPATIGSQLDDLYRAERAERAKQLLRGKLDRVAGYRDDEFADDYRKSLEDFFNRNCCIEQQHHRHAGASGPGGRFFPKGPVAPKNKSMLEVKPPNRFDDTSSGSTDLELDDFNFDFEKYWEELEKPSPTSPSELEERKGAAAAAMGKKVKNVNLSRCYNNGTVIDIYHDDDPYHRDHYHYREGGAQHHHPGAGKVSNNHRHNPHHASVTTPRGRGATRHKVYPADGAFDPPRPLGLGGDDGEREQVRGGPKYAQHPGGGKTPAAPQDGTAGSAFTSNSNAISFLNNIFSIYKPNKYSPLNCHGEQNYLKNIPAKKMNIVASSAVRPLGSGVQATGGAGGDASSTKRPLTVHPAKPSVASVASAARRSARPAAPPPSSGKEPQARFQIIPDKTGVRISPLYRLDAQDYRRARYKLKSTSRPLSFW